MKDKRHDRLASILIDYSLTIKPKETLYLEIKGKETIELGKQVIRIATERGANVFWYYSDESILRQFVGAANDDQMKLQSDMHLKLMETADCYIGLRGSDNPFDMADLDQKRVEAYNRIFYKPVHLEQRVKHTRWVVLRYPNNAMAQLAQTSTESFEDFYFDVCCADYPKMDKAQEPLQQMMMQTDKVRIVSPGTDLRFSIKNIPARKCAGNRNIPDGEVFTAPVRDSVNGTIRYNTPTLYQGNLFTNVTLAFENGKIIKATADQNNEKLEQIFNTDEGARYVGEFAIGLNPFILHPMKDTLFDEKIAGSIHFTPGQCYEETENGNRSAIHWDMVLIQRKDYGGGELWFDDKLIRKDGVFTDAKMEASFSKEALKG